MARQFPAIEPALAAYRAEKNAHSLDGLPTGLPTGPA